MEGSKCPFNDGFLIFLLKFANQQGSRLAKKSGNNSAKLKVL